MNLTQISEAIKNKDSIILNNLKTENTFFYQVLAERP